MSAAFDAYADEVTSALTGHWDPPGKARGAEPAWGGAGFPFVRELTLKVRYIAALANPAIWSFPSPASLKTLYIKWAG